MQIVQPALFLSCQIDHLFDKAILLCDGNLVMPYSSDLSVAGFWCSAYLSNIHPSAIDPSTKSSNHCYATENMLILGPITQNKTFIVKDHYVSPVVTDMGLRSTGFCVFSRVAERCKSSRKLPVFGSFVPFQRHRRMLSMP